MRQRNGLLLKYVRKTSRVTKKAWQIFTKERRTNPCFGLSPKTYKQASTHAFIHIYLSLSILSWKWQNEFMIRNKIVRTREKSAEKREKRKTKRIKKKRNNSSLFFYIFCFCFYILLLLFHKRDEIFLTTS